MASLRITEADRDEHGVIKTMADPPATPRAIDPFDHTPLNLAVEADPARAPATDQPTRIAPRLLRAGGIIVLLVAGLLIILIAVSPAGPRALPMGAPTRASRCSSNVRPNRRPHRAGANHHTADRRILRRRREPRARHRRWHAADLYRPLGY